MTDSFSSDRRDLLASLGLLGTAAVFGLTGSAQGQAGRGEAIEAGLGWDAGAGKYVLPPLGYAYDALEPHIDAKTMEIHHSKHHQGYVTGLNKALDQLAAIRAGQGDAGLVGYWCQQVSFHGGGHVNHSLFWRMMAPQGDGVGGEPPRGALSQAIERDFGSFASFRATFSDAAKQVQGSGWAWLVREPFAGRLLVLQMGDQHKMLFTDVRPILGIDVWEHAYYLKHQNKRADYVEVWWNVVNWNFAQRLYDAASA